MTANGLCRKSTLRHLRLAASRLSRFAACSGAPSHRLPQGPGHGIVAGQVSALKVAGGGLIADTALRSVQHQVRQLRHVGRDPPRLNAGCALGRD